MLGFDSVSEITQDFTDDTNKLARGIRMLRPGGGTALFDAIYEASKSKLATAQAKVPTRRAIILLSDGEDNQSRVTRDQAIEMAQRAEVIIYAISTNISGIKTRGDKVLERFAETTGGRVFFPTKLDEVAQAFTPDPGRTSQPVRVGLQAGGVHRRRPLPHHRDRVRQKRIAHPLPPRVLRAEAVRLHTQRHYSLGA